LNKKATAQQILDTFRDDKELNVFLLRALFGARWMTEKGNPDKAMLVIPAWLSRRSSLDGLADVGEAEGLFRSDTVVPGVSVTDNMNLALDALKQMVKDEPHVLDHKFDEDLGFFDFIRDATAGSFAVEVLMADPRLLMASLAAAKIRHGSCAVEPVLVSTSKTAFFDEAGMAEKAASWAGGWLRHVYGSMDPHGEIYYRDAVCDIMHACRKAGVDFDTELHAAQVSFLEEVEAEEEQ
jgi:hypothetical protein